MAQGDKPHHEISMSAGIMSNQAYDTRLTYQYYLNKSIGVGASFGYYKQWHANHIPQSELHHEEWDYWKLSEKDYRPQNFYLEPSLSINSPAIARSGKVVFQTRSRPWCNVPASVYSRFCKNISIPQHKITSKKHIHKRYAVVLLGYTSYY